MDCFCPFSSKEVPKIPIVRCQLVKPGTRCRTLPIISIWNHPSARMQALPSSEPDLAGIMPWRSRRGTIRIPLDLATHDRKVGMGDVRGISRFQSEHFQLRYEK